MKIERGRREGQRKVEEGAGVKKERGEGGGAERGMTPA